MTARASGTYSGVTVAQAHSMPAASPNPRTVPASTRSSRSSSGEMDILGDRSACDARIPTKSGPPVYRRA